MGKARYEYSSRYAASVVARLQLEMDLRRALEHQEFHNVYQRSFSLAAGQIVGFEALLRWQHPTRGLLGPRNSSQLRKKPAYSRFGLVEFAEACRQ